MVSLKARPSSSSSYSLLPFLFLVIASIGTILPSSSYGALAAISCSSSSHCPSSSPCCSAEGQCGSGAMQCAGGCNPMFSFKPTSCQPNPICKNQNITFSPNDFNNANMFRPILQYTGDPSLAPFTLDSGTIGKGPEGILMQLVPARQSKFSTTNYMLYGSMEVTARHNVRKGVVAAFITMSDIKDEIDWEFTGGNASQTRTNYFWMGTLDHNNGEDITPSSSFNVADWHTYGLNWQPNQLQWSIDGKVVRTLTRSKAGSTFPRSPSRVQFSLWAGGNSTNSQGVIEWAGGPIDWNSAEFQQNGYYSQEIKSFTLTCLDLSSLNLLFQGGASGAGNSSSRRRRGTPNDYSAVTSYIYTGTNSSSTGEPEFELSTQPIHGLKDPGKDGIPGYPGYNTATPGTKNSNSGDWGDTGADSSGSSTSSKVIMYAVPIAAAVGGVVLIWAVTVACMRSRRKKNQLKDFSAVGVTGIGGVAVERKGTSGGSASRSGVEYSKLDNTFAIPMGTRGNGRNGQQQQQHEEEDQEENVVKYYDMVEEPVQRRQSTAKLQYGRGYDTPNVNYYSTPMVGYNNSSSSSGSTPVVGGYNSRSTTPVAAGYNGGRTPTAVGYNVGRATTPAAAVGYYNNIASPPVVGYNNVASPPVAGYNYVASTPFSGYSVHTPPSYYFQPTPYYGHYPAPHGGYPTDPSQRQQQ